MPAPAVIDETYQVKRSETFTSTIVLNKENQTIKLSWYDDDYFFYSEYLVSKDGVIPQYMRYTGAFVSMYCFLISIFGTSVIYWVVKRYLFNNSNS